MIEGDLEAVSAIFASHTGGPPPSSWRQRVDRLLQGGGLGDAVALVAVALDERDAVVGYLVAEVRSWEFGSEPAGWIFALGVEPSLQRGGIASHLLASAVERMQRIGISTIRTMVRRDDVGVLTFFRSSGFVAGPYTELELTLEEPAP